MIETSCSAGSLCGGRKGCHRNSSAGKRLLMQLWEALPVQGNPAAEKRIKEKTADNKKGEDKDEKVQE